MKSAEIKVESYGITPNNGMHPTALTESFMFVVWGGG